MEEKSSTSNTRVNTRQRTDQKGRRRKRGSKAGKIVLAVCIVAAAAGAGFYFYQRQNSSADSSMVASDPVYEYATRMDMQSTYTSNGRVISTVSKASDTPQGFDQSGYTVKEVKVKAGDTVKKGDVLYTIDMTSVQEDLEQNQKKLALQQQQNGIDTAAKQRAAANAKASTSQQLADNQRTLDEATEDTNQAIATQNENVDAVNQAILKQQAAQDKVNEAQLKYNNAKSQYDTLKAQNDAAQEKINTAKSLSDIASAKVSRMSAEGAGPDDEGYRQAVSDAAQRSEELTQLQAANTKLSDDTEKAKTAADDAKAALDSAQTELDNAKTEVENAVKTVSDSASDVQSKQRTLEQQQSDIDSKNRDAQESLNSANDTLASAALSNESSLQDLQNTIEQDEEKLQHGTVTANMDGTVTQVNVAAGQNYSGNAAVVISDLNALTIATDVDEAYVNQISTGMKVSVTTDATGTQTLSGKVTYVAPFPTDSTVTGTADATGSTTTASTTLLNSKQKVYYRVEVSLDDGYSQLREGMNAKITFILAEAKDAIAVPKDTITTNADGTSYITVVDDGTITADSGAAVDDGTISADSDAATDDGTISTDTGDASDVSQDQAQETAADGTTTAAAETQSDLTTQDSEGSTSSDDLTADSTVSGDTADTSSDTSAVSEDSSAADTAADDSGTGYAPTVQLQVTTGIEQGDNVQITSGNVTESMQIVGPNTYNTYGYTDGSDSSSLLEGLY